MDLVVPIVVPIVGVAGMAIVGLVVFGALRPGMQRASRRKLHNTALADLARELGLETTPTGQELDHLAVPLGRIRGGIVSRGFRRLRSDHLQVV